jgi:hypothetical protein
MKTVEKNVRSEVNKEFEQIRASDKHEIQQLKSILEEMHRIYRRARDGPPNMMSW